MAEPQPALPSEPGPGPLGVSVVGSPPALVVSSGVVVAEALDVGAGEGCDVSPPEGELLGAVVIGADVDGAVVGGDVVFGVVGPGATTFVVVPGAGVTSGVGEPLVTDAVGLGTGC